MPTTSANCVIAVASAAAVAEQLIRCAEALAKPSKGTQSAHSNHTDSPIQDECPLAVLPWARACLAPASAALYDKLNSNTLLCDRLQLPCDKFKLLFIHA
jgi:hypothetical protein